MPTAPYCQKAHRMGKGDDMVVDEDDEKPDYDDEPLEEDIRD